jgi:ABC-type branched-subunit amino acid transport system ATPase component
VLEVRGLESGYKRSTVLQGVDLDLASGQVLGLLGRNGVGKSTLINTLMGLVHASAGSVRLDGVDLTHRRPDVIARAGVALVPQGRRVWAPLTVTEHLDLARAIVDMIGEVIGGMKAEGVTLVVVEQDLHLAFAVADEIAVMDKGRVVHRSPTLQFRSDSSVARALLGVA